MAIDANTARGIGLGIRVDQQGLAFGGGQRRRQVHRSGGLADASLLVRDCYYQSHIILNGLIVLSYAILRERRPVRILGGMEPIYRPNTLE